MGVILITPNFFKGISCPPTNLYNRKVYFDAKTKIHLQQYLDSRKDENEALFVSLLKPYNRLEISGVEIMLRKNW